MMRSDLTHGLRSAMYLIKNDDQKLKALRHIEDFDRKIARIGEAEGAEAAKLFRQAYESQIGELREQVKEYEALREHGLPPASFTVPFELGRYLVKARIAAGLTQEELARKLNVSQPMVHKYELSEYAGCRLDLLTRVAEALGVSVAITAAWAGMGMAAACGRSEHASVPHA
jgi:DNA-binding XRE family transcriptional regulator